MFGRLRFATAVACLLMTRVVLAQDGEADDVTRHLFQSYVARQVKVNTSSILAATHLVAERGRESGFWKEVLAELKRNNEQSELGCVRVLGKMLAIDAAARDVLRRQKETGEISAWVASVRLGPEVVTELIERGQKADRNHVDHYTIALARARVAEANGFFESILRNSEIAQAAPPVVATPRRQETAPARIPYDESTRFHAAVGLAQLGDLRGIDWLIASCEYSQGSVWHAWPRSPGQSGSLSPCCVAALQDLSGNRNLTTKAEWEAWAKTADKATLTKHAVNLIETNGF